MSGCLLSCGKEGVWEKSASCGHIIITAYNNIEKLRAMASLANLPSSVFDKTNVIVHIDPYKNLDPFSSMIIGGFVNNYHIRNGRLFLAADTSPEVVIHEFFHQYALQQKYFTIANLNPLLGMILIRIDPYFGIPEAYAEIIGFQGEEGGKYIYTKYPVMPYGGDRPDQIPLVEDFAISAEAYVFTPDYLFEHSPERYIYFRDEVFGGKEYR
jgi:hypothetical protein